MKRPKSSTDIKVLILVIVLIFIALTQTGCATPYIDPRLEPYVKSVYSVLEQSCGLKVSKDISYKINDLKGRKVGVHVPRGFNQHDIAVDIKFFNTYQNTFAIDYLLIHEISHAYGIKHIHGHNIQDVTTNYRRLANLDPLLNLDVRELCEVMKINDLIGSAAPISVGM